MILPALLVWVAAAAAASPGILVVPPEQPTPDPETAWVGETVSALLPRSLALAGAAAVEREDRLRAQSALEIPLVALTRATSIRVAEAVGATRLAVGSYTVESGRLTLALRLLDAERGTLSPPFVGAGPLETLADLVHGMAWEMALTGPARPALTREQFQARRPALSYDALQSYGLGLSARNPSSRLKLMRRALALAPQHHEARLALGRLQLEAGEFTSANDTLARIPEGSPQARAARFLQGVAQLEVGRYADAAALYAALAAADPTPAVLNNYALALLRGPRRELRASDLLKKAVELDPAALDLAFNVGWALLVEGDPQTAEFFLRDVVRREPLDGQARVLLSWTLRRAGRQEDAEREWQGVVAVSPAFVALQREDFGRRFERILPIERLLGPARGSRTATEVAAGLIGRAERLSAAGDATGALRELIRAAYLDPYAPRIHLLLARAYRAGGARHEALNEFQMTLWSQEDPAIRAEMAELLKEMGREQEARSEAEKVLRADPANEAARRLVAP